MRFHFPGRHDPADPVGRHGAHGVRARAAGAGRRPRLQPDGMLHLLSPGRHDPADRATSVKFTILCWDFLILTLGV